VSTWTDERTELAVKLWQGGKTAAEVAKELGGVTRNAVIGKMHRMGLAGGSTRRVFTDGLHWKEREKLRRRLESAGRAQPTRATVEKREQAIKQAPAPKPLPLPPPVLLTGQERRWTAREFGQCAWPVAGEGAETLSCCAPTNGKTYCPTHHKLAHLPRSTMNAHDRKYFSERVA
jgi:GcrA cell cycle regulator